VFTEGQVYKRSEIHDRYGGNRQSGICPSARAPYIFVFTGSSGVQYGYKDEWLNQDIFSYTGEGQNGDMEFTKGNLALRDHILNGKQIFLFEYVAKGFVKYLSEMKFLDCDFFETHDTIGEIRIGIKFFFQRMAVNRYDIPSELRQTHTFQDEQGPYAIKMPNETERRGLVLSRVGQGAYRKSILHRWEYKCAVTHFNDPRVLIASHIVPWKDSTDTQWLDVDNGILLSPDFDALFDKHLISFERSGKILISDAIPKSSLSSLGITGKEVIAKLSDGNKEYLDIHCSRLA